MSEETSVVINCPKCFRTIWQWSTCYHGKPPIIKKKKLTDLEIIEKNLKDIPPNEKLKKV